MTTDTKPPPLTLAPLRSSHVTGAAIPVSARSARFSLATAVAPTRSLSMVCSSRVSLASSSCSAACGTIHVQITQDVL